MPHPLAYSNTSKTTFLAFGVTHPTSRCPASGGWMWHCCQGVGKQSPWAKKRPSVTMATNCPIGTDHRLDARRCLTTPLTLTCARCLCDGEAFAVTWAEKRPTVPLELITALTYVAPVSATHICVPSQSNDLVPSALIAVRPVYQTPCARTCAEEARTHVRTGEAMCAQQ